MAFNNNNSMEIKSLDSDDEPTPVQKTIVKKTNLLPTKDTPDGLIPVQQKKFNAPFKLSSANNEVKEKSKMMDTDSDTSVNNALHINQNAGPRQIFQYNSKSITSTKHTEIEEKSKVTHSDADSDTPVTIILKEQNIVNNDVLNIESVVHPVVSVPMAESKDDVKIEKKLNNLVESVDKLIKTSTPLPNISQVKCKIDKSKPLSFYAHSLHREDLGKQIMKIKPYWGPNNVPDCTYTHELFILQSIEYEEIKCKNGCGNVLTKLCTHCRQVYYCSIGCQKEDWGVHREMYKKADENVKQVKKTVIQIILKNTLDELITVSSQQYFNDWICMDEVYHFKPDQRKVKHITPIKM